MIKDKIFNYEWFSEKAFSERFFTFIGKFKTVFKIKLELSVTKQF